MKSIPFSTLIVLMLFCSITKAQDNEFKIGIFGASSFMTHSVGGCNVPFETPLDGSGNKTSLFNVLAEDGFNIYQTYAPSEWTTLNSLISEIRLAGANGLQVELGSGHYYKPSVDASGNYLGYGTNEYGNCGNNIGDCQSPYSQNYFRADIDNYLENVFANNEFRDIIWGYHMCEEASYYHWCHTANNCQGNVWQNPLYFKNVEIPPVNVSSAINHFKTNLGNEGISHQKMVIMEANHHKSINANTNDGQGNYNPQDYINLLNKNDSRDVFFEGSYTQFPASSWVNQSYANINNSGPGNNWHYLGKFKSIDFAETKCSNVHKVVASYVNEPNLLYHLHSNLSIRNANWLWFQTYNSIVHGAKGVWFWWLVGMWEEGETGNIWGTTQADRYEREHFPNAYRLYLSNLSKELRYLVNNNIISTDPNTIVATKTDEADPNCIVPAITSSSYQLYTSVPSEKKTENYSLRYTIRTNGTETYMIVTNPLNIPVTVTLNFSNSSNQIIQSSTGAYIMFDNNQYGPISNYYKVNRNSNINLTSNTVGNKYYVAYTTNKQLTLSFGAMDVKVLKFLSSPPNNNNGWDRTWSNYGSGNINGHHVSDGDLFYTGDFDGDGSEELLCVANNGWITVLKYINNDWEWLWSNYGSSSAGNGIYPYRNSFIVGDFDGDGKDELLGNILNGWTTMFKYNNGNWNWIWSDNGSSSHPIRPYKDKFYAGDFNGDGRDELFGCDLPDGWTTMFRWNGSNFAWYWSDNGINHSIRPYRSNMIAGDFDSDGKTELLGFSSWATLFHFDNNNWQWGWSTYGTSNFNGWTYPIPSTDRILAGNLDSDTKDELFFLQTQSSAAWATTMDLKSDQSAWNWNWSANPQYSITFIDDWSLASNGGSNTKYYLVKAKANERKYLLSMRKFCNNYLVNMYKPIGSSNKSAVISTDENTFTTESVTTELINSISVYPNPVQNILNISMPDALQYRIEIIDLNGKKIKFIDNAEGFINIDCSNVNAGIYLLRAYSSEKIYQKKIVVTK